MIEGNPIFGDETVTFDGACSNLLQSIEGLRAQPKLEELQKDVCLGTRTVDSIFQIEALFHEAILPDDFARAEGLIEQALDSLPRGTTYWDSVSERLFELQQFADNLKSGELLNHPTTFSQFR